MRSVATVAAVLGLAALPATADARSYFSNDDAHGAYVIGTSHHIDQLQVFCVGSTHDTRQLRFDTALRIGVRHRKFSYSGTVYRYGPNAEPRGKLKGKVAGHLNGSRSISIRWKLPGCGSGTSFAPVLR